MSSRAIIASSIKNGYFSSWCWVNGDPVNIGKILRTNFMEQDEIEELISYKSILGIFKDPSEDNHEFLTGSFAKLKNGLYVKYDDGMDTVVSGGLNGFFPTISTMLKENVQFIYVFDEGTWKTYQIENQVVTQTVEETSQELKENEEKPLNRKGKLRERLRERRLKVTELVNNVHQTDA